jgi:hypothetical protein
MRKEREREPNEPYRVHSLFQRAHAIGLGAPRSQSDCDRVVSWETHCTHGPYSYNRRWEILPGMCQHVAILIRAIAIAQRSGPRSPRVIAIAQRSDPRSSSPQVLGRSQVLESTLVRCCNDDGHSFDL